MTDTYADSYETTTGRVYTVQGQDWDTVKGAIEETTFRRFADKGILSGVKFKNAFWYSIDSHKDLEECSKALKGKKP